MVVGVAGEDVLRIRSKGGEERSYAYILPKSGDSCFAHIYDRDMSGR